MRDDEAAARSGGTGLLTAGAVIAVVIGLATYMSLRENAQPSPDALKAVVPPEASVPSADTPSTGPAESRPTDVAAVAPAVEAEAEPEADAQENATVGDTQSESVADAETAAAAQVPAPDAARVLPTIDEVRVGVDGILVIAGRAAPGSTVSVLVDGVEVASATADGSGAFAAVGSAAPSETARVLSLRATGADEVLSSLDEVILAPVSVQADPVETVAVTAPAVTPQTAESGSVGAAGAPAPAPEVVGTPEAEAEAVASAPQTTDVPQPPETAETQAAPTVSAENETEEVAEATPAPAETEPAAANGPQASVAVSEPEAPQVASPSDPQPQQGVAVLKSTAEGVTLVPQSPQVLDRIALDTIGYSDAGDVRLSGRTSLAASAVRVYLNNRAVVTLPVDESGGWRGNLPDVDAGIYTLRVDAVDAGGQVTSRVETPFKREAKDVLAAASAGQTGPVAAVTVQTGDTLWAIARDRYGEGLLYVKVFEANRTSIRDPDLIYPGQVFDLPVE